VVIRERDLRDLHRDRVGRTVWRLILSRILTAISALGVTREIIPDVHFQALADTRSPSACRKQHPFARALATVAVVLGVWRALHRDA
jgi:hypothetical protein